VNRLSIKKIKNKKKEKRKKKKEGRTTKIKRGILPHLPYGLCHFSGRERKRWLFEWC
jgi:hypothetical protein